MSFLKWIGAVAAIVLAFFLFVRDDKKVCGNVMPSVGAIERAGAIVGKSPTGIDEYLRRLREAFSLEKGSIAVIGHQAGDYQSYPQNAAALQAKKDIAPMMRESFERLGLHGIEIDVHPGEKGEVFVLHDRIEEQPSKEASAYLQRNSLENVLNDFVAHGYQRKYKVLIELKVRHGYHLEKNEQYFLKQVVKILNNLLKRYPGQANQLTKQIGFVSFNFDALKIVSGHLDRPMPFNFIVTSNKAIVRVAAMICPHLSALDDDMLDRIVKASFLTGIWFDPQYIEGFATLFTQLNKRRLAVGHGELGFGLGVYFEKREAFFQRIEAQAANFPFIEAVIIDINP